MPDDEKVREELRRRQTDQIIGRRHDPAHGSYDTVQTADKVPEDHVYLFQTMENGDQLVWEADLIGDLSPDAGHGQLPPVLHIECPFCTSIEDRRAMSITKENKDYEIERLQKPYVRLVNKANGPRNVLIDRHLHVKEEIRCAYCQTRFWIRGSRIERA